MAVSLKVRLSLAATLLVFLKQGFGEEICLNEVANVSCSEDEELFIESAIIGRLNDSRCYNRTDGEQECRNDIRKSVQERSRRTNSLRERHEVCMTKEFKVECEDSMIEIQSAVFGRMRNSRCIDFDTQNLSCGQDVKMFFKSICDKRKNCSVSIQPGLFNNSSCDRRLEQYLEVSHTCLHTSTGPPEPHSPSRDWLTYLFVVATAISVASCAAVIHLSYKCKRDDTENVKCRNDGEESADDYEADNDHRLQPFVISSNDLYTEEQEEEQEDRCRSHSRNQYYDCQMKDQDEDAYSECKFPLEEQYSVLGNTDP